MWESAAAGFDEMIVVGDVVNDHAAAGFGYVAAAAGYAVVVVYTCFS